MTDNLDNSSRKRSVEKRNIILAVIGASIVAALITYGSLTSMQQQVKVEGTLGRVLITKTMTSVRDPGAGHESHQVAMFLPPLGEDVIYSGTITWASSGPVELFIYHHYDGPADNSPPLYTEPSNNVTYASPLFHISPDYADHGSIQLAGNAIGFHSLEGLEFTVTATFDGWTKKVTLLDPYSGNIETQSYIIRQRSILRT